MYRDLISDNEYDNEYEITGAERAAEKERRVAEKVQRISLVTSGISSVEDLAVITRARPSYIALVLQEAGLMSGYFDLYTTTSHPMNVYSKFFAGRLGYRDEATARQSVE